MTLRKGDRGENVKTLQSKLKTLDFLQGTVDGIFGPKTEEAVKKFQKKNNLVVDGIAGTKTLAALGIQFNSTSKIHGTAKEMDWWKSDIQKIFAKGVTATITDVATGLSWKEQRRGGKNHADVQPISASDTAKLKKAYGGTWSWARRPIFVTINGVNYAASMNGMPHGGDSISGNNFDGHHCIHFTNSRTHGTDRVDENHQKAIKKALKATL